MASVSLPALFALILAQPPSGEPGPPSDTPQPDAPQEVPGDAPDPDPPARSDDVPAPTPTPVAPSAAPLIEKLPAPPTEADCKDVCPRLEPDKDSAEAPPDKPPTKPGHELDATEFSIGGGLLVTSGNTRTSTFNAGTSLRIRRGRHQSTTTILLNGGSAASDNDELRIPNVSNQLARTRYDAFLPLNFVAFGQVQWRRDPFQGLETRLNFSPGIGYYFLDTVKNRVWMQTGYDYQLDVRARWRIYDADDGGDIFLDGEGQPTRILPLVFPAHQVRLFMGTENNIRDQATIKASVEYLQNFLDVERYILNGEFSADAHLVAGVSLGASLIVRHEHVPLPRVEQTDTLFTFNVLYKLNDARLAQYEENRRKRRAKRATKSRARSKGGAGRAESP